MNRDAGFHPEQMEDRYGPRNGDGEDRRYLRRRANRRVRKAQITRSVARWSWILLLQLAFGALVVTIAHRAWTRVVASSEFSLKTIELKGTQRAEIAAIREALELYRGDPMFGLDLAEIAHTIRQDPWVLDASLKRVLPDTLQIEVRERSPCAVAIIGGLAHLVDAEGFVIGPTGLRHSEDLPVLEGLPDGDPLRLSLALIRGVKLLARLRGTSPEFVDGISELDLSQDDRITLRTVVPGPLLFLDPDEVDRNVLRFLALRTVIRDHVGTARFVDLRWQDRVSVMPVQPGPAREG